ncbi:MAG: ribonuclease G [Pseudomonadota bacterium]
MSEDSAKEEILINVTPSEVRAALLENGVLQEVFVEREGRRGLISNIYLGTVSRVLPGMQAAFIDIGLERTAFLHASDITRSVEDSDATEDELPNIRELVREGDSLLVQVVKDPLGNKGARLTTFITLPSRHLVLLPKSSGVGISSRIEDPEERDRLRAMTEQLLADQGLAGGAIVRTVAEGAQDEALAADLKYLARLWEVVQLRCSKQPVKQLVHEDLALPLRVLRDLVTVDVENILVDSEDDFDAMTEFSATFLPEIESKLELYRRRRPIFDLHGIEEEIKRSLERNIPLKSGGYLIFDQTEAMTTIDVNTGAYVGHRNLEETIYRTNLEAAVAIARQLRLRNLGGIIIIDFIDMEEVGHRENVLAVLEQSMQGDNARHQITPVSPLGLVEMTRKRTRESLQHILCDECPTCNGKGFILTVESVCFEVFREVIRQARQFDFDEVMVLAHQDVIEMLLDEQAPALAELQEQTGKTLRLQTEALYFRDQFDVVLM